MRDRAGPRVVRDTNTFLCERYMPGGLRDDPESKVHSVFLIKPRRLLSASLSALKGNLISSVRGLICCQGALITSQAAEGS